MTRYNDLANDFLMVGALDGDPQFTWFSMWCEHVFLNLARNGVLMPRSIALEGLVQLPLFFFATYHLYHSQSFNRIGHVQQAQPLPPR